MASKILIGRHVEGEKDVVGVIGGGVGIEK